MVRFLLPKISLLWHLPEPQVHKESELEQSSSTSEDKNLSASCSWLTEICSSQRIVQITPRQDLKACKQSSDPHHKLESATIRRDLLQSDYSRKKEPSHE